MYRPVEEVAKSFEARAKDPQDKWPSENDFKLGVRNWNRALGETREFLQGGPDRKVLIVDYHDFFRGDEACISTISEFLGLEFDESVRRAWRGMSVSRRNRPLRRKRRREPLSEEQKVYIRENKDYTAETWALDRIDWQYDELDERTVGAKRTRWRAWLSGLHSPRK